MTLLRKKLAETGPKRILALDGGGVRGALSLGFLAKIEELLRDRHGDPRLSLADYFDLIGGTSTGAIIASALAFGYEVATIRDWYLDLARSVFGERTSSGLFSQKYSSDALEKTLDSIFGDRVLGSAEIKTGLCIVTKRADTNRVWPFFNHPEGRYYTRNKDLKVKNLIRASTAAPTYFKSVTIDLTTTGGRPLRGEFVDGGTSMHNNPALLLFNLATLKGYPFQWRRGERSLLLVSVGTGHASVRAGSRGFFGSGGVGWAKQLVYMLMEDASWSNQQMLQYLSSSPTAVSLDSEVGSLDYDLLGDEAHLSYLRYDVPLERDIARTLRLGDLPVNADELSDIDASDNVGFLDALGKTASSRLTHAIHFPRAFDLPKNDRA